MLTNLTVDMHCATKESTTMSNDNAGLNSSEGVLDINYLVHVLNKNGRKKGF